MPANEKRKFQRLDSLHLLDFQTFDRSGNEGEYAMGRTLDLSINGIRLETDREVPADTSLNITLAMEDNLVDVSGRFIHSFQVDSRYVSGIEFDDVDSDGRATLARYIDELLTCRAKLPEHDYPPLEIDNL